ncbi:MAG: CCA tRNA nucleotidyltransferase [Rhodobacteraceae bacterium]|nr:CCA tRNA nucleotidyltransferase [Paracoccaceae bacterium]
MTTVQGKWLSNPHTQAVFSALIAEGAQALFVGGCVRNALMGVAVSDVDIATDAHPETVMELAKTAGIKAIPTGIDHGTVTLVSGGIPHEITTFRRDVATDGRRAVVAYSDNIQQDAARRDFTMNALYAGIDGVVVDPLGGLPDLLARRVRFIGSATDRIQEDYLRSLRFFRFQAWYGDPNAGFDPDSLAAIADNLDGLEQLSAERVGSEMVKLMTAPDPSQAVAVMRQTGVLARILPGADDRALGPLVHLETLNCTAPDAMRRLAALGGADGLRLSRVQLARVDRLRDAATGMMGAGELGFRLKFDEARDALLLRAALLEQSLEPGVLQSAQTGSKADFPIKARDLMPALQGPALGKKLNDLTQKWIKSNFTLTRDDLLGE